MSCPPAQLPSNPENQDRIAKIRLNAGVATVLLDQRVVRPGPNVRSVRRRSTHQAYPSSALDLRGLEIRAQGECSPIEPRGSIRARNLRTTSSRRAPSTIARIGPNLLERRNSTDAPESAAIKSVDWRIYWATFIYRKASC